MDKWFKCPQQNSLSLTKVPRFGKNFQDRPDMILVSQTLFRWVTTIAVENFSLSYRSIFVYSVNLISGTTGLRGLEGQEI